MEGNSKRYKLWLDNDEKNVPRSTFQDYRKRNVETVSVLQYYNSK